MGPAKCTGGKVPAGQLCLLRARMVFGIPGKSDREAITPQHPPSGLRAQALER